MRNTGKVCLCALEEYSLITRVATDYVDLSLSLSVCVCEMFISVN